VLLVLVLQLYV
jgi:hypothetical protein